MYVVPRAELSIDDLFIQNSRNTTRYTCLLGLDHDSALTARSPDPCYDEAKELIWRPNRLRASLIKYATL